MHGNTAAEVIYNRADREREFMGLTTFTGSRPHLTDVVIAKNYLTESELESLGQIVSGYLDFAERQAKRQVIMNMSDWAVHLDRILTATGEQLLSGAGKISHARAIEKAEQEYKAYQNKTLSSVEKAFLENINELEKRVKGKVDEKKK